MFLVVQQLLYTDDGISQDWARKWFLCLIICFQYIYNDPHVSIVNSCNCQSASNNCEIFQNLAEIMVAFIGMKLRPAKDWNYCTFPEKCGFQPTASHFVPHKLNDVHNLLKIQQCKDIDHESKTYKNPLQYFYCSQSVVFSILSVNKVFKGGMGATVYKAVKKVSFWEDDKQGNCSYV